MATTPNHIAVSEDFVSDSIARQIYVFQNSSNKSARIQIHAERWQVLMDQIQTICEARLLQNAEGVCLDDIGKQMRVTRYSDDDDVYTTSILIREYGTSNAVTRTNIVTLIEDIFDVAGDEVYMVNYPYNGMELVLLDVCVTDTSLFEEIKRILPILTRYTFGVKTTGKLIGFGSLQELEDQRTSDNEVVAQSQIGMLGSLQTAESDGEPPQDYTEDDWGYFYQIEESI